MKPKVSIIINNYNYASFVPEAVESSMSQTYRRVEIIIVDDFSTDNSRDVICRYNDRATILFHQQNGKQGAAFNSGFSSSTGDIIIFLDADDYLYPNAAEHIVQSWNNRVAKVHYRLDVVDAAGHSRGYSYPQGGRLDGGELHNAVLNRGTYAGVPTSGNAISRRVLEQVMPIPAEFNTTSDDYLSVLVPLYGEVVAIETPLGAYRIHGSNQWALAETVTSDRFRRFIHHDMQRCQLLREKGTALGYDVPEDLETRFFGRIWSRLASLKFDPQQHPVESDSAISLSLSGIKAIWKYSDHPWKKQILFTLWFLWVGLMPSPMAKPAIAWLFAPSSRPKPVNWTLTKLRSLVAG